MSGELEVRLSDEQLVALADLIVARLPKAADDPWLPTSAAAEYLGVHPVTLRRAAAERRIQFEQNTPGGRLRFRRSDLDRWTR